MSTSATALHEPASLPSERSSVERGLAFLRRHWALAALLAVGTALRLLVQVAYQPAILFIDSYTYLEQARTFDPEGIHPIGYSVLLLSWLLPLGGMTLVTLVQHLFGVALGVLTYVVLLRRGAPRWLATLAATPVLVSGYQLQIEHNIMAEPLFELLLLGSFAVLLWRPQPRTGTLAAVGLLLGVAGTVRPVAQVLVAAVVLVGVFAWWRARSWKGVTALLACFCLPLVTYASWHAHVNGEFQLSNAGSGTLLYARTAPLAECGELANAPAHIRDLCPDTPVDDRKKQDFYAHHQQSPSRNTTYPPGTSRREAMYEFGMTVVRNQPLTVAAAMTGDFLRGFVPARQLAPGDVSLERWRFSTTYPDYTDVSAQRAIRAHGGDGPHVNTTLAHFLRSYQNVGYAPGTLLGVLLLLALAGAAGLGRARRSELRWECLLPATTGTMLLAAAAMFEFAWRYQLPALVLFPLAGGLGITALLGRGRPAPARTQPPAPEPHRPQ